MRVASPSVSAPRRSGPLVEIGERAKAFAVASHVQEDVGTMVVRSDKAKAPIGEIDRSRSLQGLHPDCSTGRISSTIDVRESPK